LEKRALHKNKLNLILVNLLIIFLFCLNSCAIRAEQKSLTSQFNTIDALINQGQTGDAIKLLRKTEKKVYDSWSYIGIYKRYKKMGQEDLCLKLLIKAVKQNSENPELNAVYTKFLINQNKIDEALQVAKKLEGSKYGSLYSEALLKSVADKRAGAEDNLEYYSSSDFFNVFYEAYLGSKNPVWLKNTALIDLKKGLYSNAAGLAPDAYSNADDAYFWALIFYDAAKFYNAIDAVNLSINYLNDFSGLSQTKTSPVKLNSLLSDSYMAVSDMQSAEAARQKVISNIDNITTRTSDAALLPVIFVNSAIYAKNTENPDYCADLLFYAVNAWPDYVPGIILYSDFAYESSLERKEDSEVLALRKAGILSTEMEKYDNRRKIPLSDALYRLDQGIEATKDPYLYIQKLDLKNKTDNTRTEKDKIRDMWQLLEDTYTEDEKYKTLLTQYVITYLLNIKQDEEAFTLFCKYMNEHYPIDAKKDFWEENILYMKNVDLGMLELAALFALKDKRINEAIRFYEYLVYESSGILEEGEISIYATTSACMNLADIYFSYGSRDKALKLYGKVAGRENKNKIRSDIYYRIANIYVAADDKKNALRSTDYAILLYPQNARASLLKEKLSD